MGWPWPLTCPRLIKLFPVAWPGARSLSIIIPIIRVISYYLHSQSRSIVFPPEFTLPSLVLFRRQRGEKKNSDSFEGTLIVGTASVVVIKSTITQF